MVLADLFIDMLENYIKIIYRIYNIRILKFSKMHKIQKFQRKTTNKNLIRSWQYRERDPPKQIQTVEKLNGFLDLFEKSVFALNFKDVLHFALKVLIIFNGYMAIFILFSTEINGFISKLMIENYTDEYLMSMSNVEKTLYTFTAYIFQMFCAFNLNAIKFQEASIDYLYLFSCFYKSEEKGVIEYDFISIARYIYVFVSVFELSPISEFNKYVTKLMILQDRNILFPMYQKPRGQKG